VRPAAHLLFFVPPPDRRPKKSRQKKGGPTARVPALCYGQPAMLAQGAMLRNSLCSLRSRRSDNRSKLEHEARASCSALARPMPCASRHGQRGGGARLGPSLRLARESTGFAVLFPPTLGAPGLWAGGVGAFTALLALYLNPSANLRVISAAGPVVHALAF